MQQLLSWLVLFLIAASLLAWSQAIRRLLAGQPLVFPEPRRPVPWNVIALLLGGGLYILLQASAGSWIISRSGIPPGTPLHEIELATRFQFLIAGALASLVAAGLSAAAILAATGCSLADLGWNRQRLASDLRLGLGAFILLAPPVYAIQAILVQWFPSEHPLIKALEQDPDIRWLAASGLVAVVAAPIVEEFFFRVLLQGWLERLSRGRWVQLAAPNRSAGVPPNWSAGVPPASIPTSQGRSVQPATPNVTEEKPADFAQNGGPSATHDADTETNPYAAPSLASMIHSEPPVPGVGVQASACPLQPKGCTPADIPNRPRDNPPVPGERTWLPSRWPIFVSAALFAAMHASHGPDPIPLFVLAVGLGYLYQQTHRILPSIIVHLLLNLLTLLALATHLFG